MHRERSFFFVGLTFALSSFVGVAPAFAQDHADHPDHADHADHPDQAGRVTDTAKPLQGQPGTFDVGGFVIRPSLELRLRGEIWSDAPSADTPAAVLASPTALGEHERDALISERLRLGLAIERGPVAVVVKLEDARAFGDRSSGFGGTNVLPYTQPYEAYLDIHTRDRDVFFRGGRQEFVLGDGRLIGSSDGSPIGRSLDGLRFAFRVSDFDVQAFAAMLAPPGRPVKPGPLKPGAQLYLVDGTWHIKPFFKAELSGIARIVRDPFPADLTPADTFVAAGRIFGDQRGFRYSVLGAFEGGRLAVIGDVRHQVGGAVAGRAELETALPWHLTFGAQGAYATGGDRTHATGTEKSFDPILPDSNDHFGHSGFYALTNIIEAGADLAVQPVDALRIRAAYRFAGMPQPRGEWFSALLEPIGYSPTNTSHILGQVIEGTVSVTPWEPLTFIADYAAMVLATGGKAILEGGGGDTSVIHYGLLEAKIRLPK